MKPINDTEQKFLQLFVAKLSLVEKYRDATLLKEALDLIPEEDLRIKATQKLSVLDEKEDQSVSLDDLVFLELLHWFKVSFFSWVDAPKCDACGHATEQKGMVSPIDAETIWEASKVEEFRCPQCESSVRFPRYNHPRKLLQTRKGRCGEWANCFTLFCYALGYDARLVWDWSDHVWTEVLSRKRNKWLHCDPCEEAFDRPLMYEFGWQKKLNYVIAFSTFDVQDVTWRYTLDHPSTCSRRTLVREEFLEYLIWSHAQKLQESLMPTERQRYEECTLEELISFLSPVTPDNETPYDGRSSGSLAWRLARGEISTLRGGGYTFQLFPEETREKHFLVKYSSALDKYVRIFDGRSVESEGWSSWTNAHTNLFRKSESDWKMVYLARTEDSDVGKVVWRFDFNSSGLVIDRVELNLSSQTFETGKVAWELCPIVAENKIIPIQEDGKGPFTTKALRGYSGFLLTVHLTEGSGAVAWQHAQLFRQSLDDSNTFPFQVEVFFTEKDGNTDAETKNS